MSANSRNKSQYTRLSKQNRFKTVMSDRKPTRISGYSPLLMSIQT